MKHQTVVTLVEMYNSWSQYVLSFNITTRIQIRNPENANNHRDMDRPRMTLSGVYLRQVQLCGLQTSELNGAEVWLRIQASFKE